MKKFYVYVHTCNANGKKYVGITTRSEPERRWGRNGEGYYQNEHFYRAILKYGWNNFQHEVFEVGSKEEMYRKEVELISFYHSNDPNFGYNHSIGGEHGYLGCKHSEETRRKISEAGKRVQKEVHSDPEYRKRISETLKKRCSNSEFKKKMSEVAKERWSDPGIRKKQSEAKKGKPLPKIKIKLPDGTIIEITKPNLGRYYIKKGKEFEYVS